MNAVLECRDVEIAVQGRTLAEHVNFAVQPGELHAIMGPSGAGKSTLLWTTLGLLPCKKGELYIAGKRLKNSRPDASTKLRKQHVGIVYQQANLLQELSVVENVAVPLMLLRNVAKDAATEQAERLLAGFGIDATTPTGHLSGGEQQRVAIARAVIHQPDMIVADEPTASLDSENATLVMDTLVQQCAQNNTSLLMVTHDPRAAAYASHQWVLAKGALQSTGPQS